MKNIAETTRKGKCKLHLADVERIMKITRIKRPEKIEVKWGDYSSVELDEENDLVIFDENTNMVWFPKSEIKNLIKALLVIQGENKMRELKKLPKYKLGDIVIVVSDTDKESVLSLEN